MSAPPTPVTEQARPLGTGPYLAAGAPFMGRYRGRAWTRGCPERVLPMRVVRDDVRGVVGWLAPGTTRLELRDADAVTARVPWRGPGVLRLAPMARPWSVLVFWAEKSDGAVEFAGWQVNLENPGQREGADLVSSDHVLDLWIDPDGTVGWKDEDELAAAVDQGRYTAGEAACIRQDGERAIEEFRSGAWPFREDWTRWEPPAGWTVPDLPADATWSLDLT